MSIQHILCVHGLGKHENDWVNTKDRDSKSLNDHFKCIWDSYNSKYGFGKYDDQIKLHSIHYDDLFEKMLDGWVEHLAAFKDLAFQDDMLAKHSDYFAEIAEKAEKAGKDEKFWRTHLVDLLLFAGIPSVKDMLITYTTEQMVKIINKETAEDLNSRFSVLCHSMGTAVTEKAIKTLQNHTVNGETISGDLKFNTIALVANTSYLLSRSKGDFFQSNFKPSSSHAGLCDFMFNVNHRFDPVGQTYPFKPFDHEEDWLDKEEKDSLYFNIKLKRLSSPDIHSLVHYISDPRFHIPYINALNGGAIPDDDIQAICNDFDKETPQNQFKSMITALKAIEVSDTKSFKTFYEAFKTLSSTIESYKKVLEG
jgi:hypothetical protein